MSYYSPIKNNKESESNYFGGDLNNKMISSEEKLLNNKMYGLNKSLSKFICVGISVKDFQPKVEFGSSKGFKIIFNEEEWNLFLEHQGVMANYLTFGNSEYTPINMENLTIYFEKFKDSRVIKLQKYNSDYLYFEKNTMDCLWEIQELINYRIQIIKYQEFEKYFNIFQNSVNINKNFNGLVSDIYDILNPIHNINSENVSTMLEMLIQYPNVLENKLKKRNLKRKYNDEDGNFN